MESIICFSRCRFMAERRSRRGASASDGAVEDGDGRGGCEAEGGMRRRRRCLELAAPPVGGTGAAGAIGAGCDDCTLESELQFCIIGVSAAYLPS